MGKKSSKLIIKKRTKTASKKKTNRSSGPSESRSWAVEDLANSEANINIGKRSSFKKLLKPLHSFETVQPTNHDMFTDEHTKPTDDEDDENSSFDDGDASISFPVEMILDDDIDTTNNDDEYMPPNSRFDDASTSIASIRSTVSEPPVYHGSRDQQAGHTSTFVRDSVKHDEGHSPASITRDMAILPSAETYAPIDILEVLCDNPYSKDVINNYNERRFLSKKDRTTIVDAIIEYVWRMKIKILSKMMPGISSKICEVFPTESPTSYYKVTEGNRKSGVLYSRYYYKLREYKRFEIDIHHEDFDDISEDVASSIAILKQEGETTDCYLENWDKTFEHRMQRYKIYDTVEELLSVWPIIGKPLGPSLIELDFRQIYGEKSIKTEDWNTFFSRNWFYITKNIKNAKGSTCCKKVSQITDPISKDPALSYLLHYLLPPALCSRLKKGERKSGKLKGRKPSMVDSRNTFLKFIKDEDLDLVIENRKIQCSLRNIKTHPFIVGIGPSRYNIVHFYVVIGDCKFKVDDFIVALDLCLKMFILFKIPYPPESRAVWILLNKIFFDIDVESKMTARVTAIYSDFTKIEM